MQVFRMARTDTTKTAFSLFLPVYEIMRKELKSYFNSYLAWLILALTAILNGLLGWWGMHKEPASDRALQLVFYAFSGTTMVAAVLLGMRLFAEEKDRGTLELLLTAPITESQIVAAKLLSAVTFLMIIMATSFPVVLMVFIYGDGSWGQVFSGYLGILLLGSASISVSLFFSTLTNIQLLAAVSAGATVVAFLLSGFFSPYLDAPMKQIMRELSFYVHYMDFEKGMVRLRHIVFFLSIISVFSYLSTVSLQSRKLR